MTLRNENKRRLNSNDFDVLVVGGGIIGASAAAAISARGVQTALVDARDFSGFTSQSSSNLIWGGIKYLQSLEAGLVRNLCVSRNQLMRAYPTSVRECRFLATLKRGSGPPRSALWLGAWLYWFLGERFTQRPSMYSAAEIRRAEPIVRVSDTAGGVEYSDAVLTMGDARFVFNLIRGAMDNDCVAVNYLEVTDLRREAGYWTVHLKDNHDTGGVQTRARVLVNAAGPFADTVSAMAEVSTRYRHVLSKGIHLVVDKLTDSGRVLAFIADDDRPFFVIPLGGRSCIGTTDTRVDDPKSDLTDADRQFVLDNANRCLDLPIPLTTRDVIAERCGVRPLAIAEGQDTSGDFLKLSRRHVVETSLEQSVVTILGGKLTDCIRVGEEVRNAVLRLGVRDPQLTRQWYGEPDTALRARYSARAAELETGSSGINATQVDRLWSWYGIRALELIEQLIDDPGGATRVLPGSDIIRAEVELIRRTELVLTANDFLRRRTLLAQTIDPADLSMRLVGSDLERMLFG